MAAAHQNLFSIRSQLVEELIDYLDGVARNAAEVPAYYPDHLRVTEKSKPPFDQIRQTVRASSNRSQRGPGQVEQDERLRRAGILVEGPLYAKRDWGRGIGSDRNRDARRGSSQPTERTIVWDENASEHFSRAVILGDPGFGKSWLLAWEARRRATTAAHGLDKRELPLNRLVLPIHIPLEVLNAAGGAIEDAVISIVGKGRSERFRTFVKSRLGGPASILLLDGWDEVTDNREALQKKLSQFIGTHRAQRVLLASRIVGFGTSPVPDAPELVLQLFGRREVEAFTEVWFRSSGETAHTFNQLLESNTSLRDLGRIPLMLSLLCRTYVPGEPLPERRGELYRRCLWGLLREWREAKALGGDVEQTERDIQTEATLALLARASENLLRAGKEIFTARELIEAAGLNLFQPEAQRFAREVRERGAIKAVAEERKKNESNKKWATEEEKTQYQFLHLTFQEYLAASSLADPKRPWAEVGSLMDRLSWSPRWHEATVLLAGKLGDVALQDGGSADRITGMLELLADPRADTFDRHRLALAVLCVVEVPEAVRCEKPEIDPRRRVPARLVRRIVRQAHEIQWAYLREDAAAALPHFRGCWPAVARADRGLGVMQDLVGRLRGKGEGLNVLRDILDVFFRRMRVGPRWDSANALGAMGGDAARREEVVEALLGCLGDRAEDTYVRERSATALGAIGAEAARRSNVIAALLVCLRDKKEGFQLRESSARALAMLGAEADLEDEVIEPLVGYLRDKEEDMFVRWNSAEALGAMRGATPGATPMRDELIAALLVCLRDKKEHEAVRWHSAAALGARGAEAARRDEVIATLLGCLDDTEMHMRAHSVEALGEMGAEAARRDEVIAALLGCLGDKEEDSYVRARSALALGAIGGREAVRRDEVIEALLVCLRDSEEHSNVRWDSAAALGAMGAEGARRDEVIAALLGCLCNKEEYFFVRDHSARALGAVGSETSRRYEVIEALLDCLRDKKEEGNVRDSSADALGAMGAETARRDDVIAALLVCLGERSLPAHFARALGDIEKAGARVFLRRAGWRIRPKMVVHQAEDLASGASTIPN